jgi:formamidopyrimidine-DNA glycosylase
MPELPEVQTVVNDLRRMGARGARILCVRVFNARTIALPGPQAFCRRVAGARIAAITRRAKFIVLELDNRQFLLMHLRMSGHLHFVAPRQPRTKHEHVVFTLDDGRELRFHDTRKFGRMFLTPRLEDVTGALGVEPLDEAFTPAVLHAILHQRARMLKPLLLDQTLIAGLGNIYTDEALWLAQLHPCRRSDTLTRAQSNLLHRAIQHVLRKALGNLGTSFGKGLGHFQLTSNAQARNQEELMVYQQTGAGCARCGTPIARLLVGQRGTHICSHCQPLRRRAPPRRGGRGGRCRHTNMLISAYTKLHNARRKILVYKAMQQQKCNLAKE